MACFTVFQISFDVNILKISLHDFKQRNLEYSGLNIQIVYRDILGIKDFSHKTLRHCNIYSVFSMLP